MLHMHMLLRLLVLTITTVHTKPTRPLRRLTQTRDIMHVRRSQCAVETSGGGCHDSLNDAIKGAGAGARVTVNRNIVVSAPIKITGDVTIVGGASGGVEVLSEIDDKAGSMFDVTCDKQTHITLKGLNFRQAEGKLGSAIRTPTLGNGEFCTDPTYAQVKLEIESCTFEGFKTGERGGGAIFIGRSSGIDISNSTFVKNTCVVPEGMGDRWESGGGAIWVRISEGPVSVRYTNFLKNSHQFQHGAGGALNIFQLQGEAIFDYNTTFDRNFASGGAALTVFEQNAPLIFNSTVVNNTAHAEEGWDARGAGLWVQVVQADLLVGGTFKDNVATSADERRSRGCAIANNQIRPGATVIISGVFENNHCPNNPYAATVWDSVSPIGSLKDGAVLIADSSSKFSSTNNNEPNPLFRLQVENGRFVTFRPTHYRVGQYLRFTSINKDENGSDAEGGKEESS